MIPRDRSSPGPPLVPAALDVGSTADRIVLGRKVALRHLRTSDFPALHQLATHPVVRATWRTRGVYWSPAELQHRVASDPHLAVVATDVTGRRLVGLAELHDVDLVDARAQLALMSHPDTWASGIALEVAFLFVRFAFDSLPLDKVAFTVQADNTRAVAGLRRLLRHEGTLRRHLNIHGRWADLEVFALFRADLALIEARSEDAPSGWVRPSGRTPQVSPAEPNGEALSTRAQMDLLFAEAGFAEHEVAGGGLCFGDLDSLLVAELLLLVEQQLGRTLASETFALEMPVADLFAFVDDEVARSRRG